MEEEPAIVPLKEGSATTSPSVALWKLKGRAKSRNKSNKTTKTTNSTTTTLSPDQVPRLKRHRRKGGLNGEVTHKQSFPSQPQVSDSSSLEETDSLTKTDALAIVEKVEETESLAIVEEVEETDSLSIVEEAEETETDSGEYSILEDDSSSNHAAPAVEIPPDEERNSLELERSEQQ